MQREKALSEAEGRAKEARENEDINRRALTLRLEEERKKVVEAINTTFRSGHLPKPLSQGSPSLPSAPFRSTLGPGSVCRCWVCQR